VIDQRFMPQAAAPKQRQAVIITVGNELTEGSILNTHFRYLGSELRSLGYRVLRGVQIPDDLKLFVAELRCALADAGVILVTGGLGPTSDDLTREAVALAAGVELDFDAGAWEQLQRRYAGRRMASPNRKQALVPHGFDGIPNPYGTAPAFSGHIGDVLLAALPGPRRELEPLFAERIVPLLAAAAGEGSGAGFLTATVMMVPESRLEEGLQHHRREGVGWGTRVADDRIVVTFRGGSPELREAALADLDREFHGLRVRRGDVRPSELVIAALKEERLRLAVAESCSGGLVAKMITDIAGSSEVFWGGFVTYANAAKTGALGVEPALLDEYGAVSREAAEAMSAGLLERCDADVGVAVTGIAGPGGGSGEKPVGTVWISVSRRGGGGQCRRFLFPGDRDLVRRRTAVAALLLTESVVRGNAYPPFPD
jgi:nicotinamide-nucleotide amidase